MGPPLDTPLRGAERQRVVKKYGGVERERGGSGAGAERGGSGAERGGAGAGRERVGAERSGAER